MNRILTIAEHEKRGRYRYEVWLGGNLLCSSSRQPLLDAARVLLAHGVDPQDHIFMRRPGSDIDCLSGLVGLAAQLTVDERNITRFRPWEPFREDSQARLKGGVAR